MSNNAVPQRHPPRPALAFEQLPDKAQALVCSLASSPSCPAHVLLAQVSKTWAAEAARHFRLEGASIELQLSLHPDHARAAAREQEVQRMQSLAEWLRQQGHLITSLMIPVRTRKQLSDPDGLAEASQVMPEVMAALVAAGRQPGGLRLQRLRVPALCSTPIFTICGALAACRQLRELHLTNSYSGQTPHSSWPTLMKLPAALQQLRHLTSLRLEGGLFRYAHGSSMGTDGFNTIISSLPRSLEVLEITGSCHDAEEAGVCLYTSSLQHLVKLQRLELPRCTYTTWDAYSERGAWDEDDGNGYNSSSHMAALTALTYLQLETAVYEYNTRLVLALPNLVALHAGLGDSISLQRLAGMASLRSLCLRLDLYEHSEAAVVLKQLTRLTSLGVLLEDGVGDPMEELPAGFQLPPEVQLHAEEELPVDGVPAADGVPVGEAPPAAEAGVGQLRQQAAGVWGGALSSLTGLCQLSLEPRVLQQVDLAALTALTCLGIDCQWSQPWHTAEMMGALLCRLAPACGRLLVVELAGLPPCLNEVCRAAVAAAVGGGVKVSFATPSAWD